MPDEVHTNGDQAPPAGEAVHLPGPSYLPVVTAAGLTLALTGIVINWIMCGVGVVITLYAVVRWVRETREDIAELPLEH
ncbi:MAG TPA: cytochrome c oxidase subunit 4 [Thermoleophilaceae bacterium]|nr:cytochrome c oxidase subunit 4 [Thermoleophilaceae bacterium]